MADTTVPSVVDAFEPAQLGPLTLVTKGESIPAGTRWHGLPATPWR